MNCTDMTSVCDKYEMYGKLLSLSLERSDVFTRPVSRSLFKIRFILKQ